MTEHMAEIAGGEILWEQRGGAFVELKLAVSSHGKNSSMGGYFAVENGLEVVWLG